jgi:cbb3-type cytochrome oxidase subunit 3
VSLADLASSSGTFWAQVALVLCLLTFLAVALFVFVGRRASSFERQRHLPLDDTVPRAGNLPDSGHDGDQR